MERWKGRVALVTGGSSGIGRATVQTLLKHGLTVVACSRNPEGIEKIARDENTDKLIAVRCDISSEEEIKEMFRIIDTRLGRIDILINNAAAGVWEDFLSGSPAGWKQTFDTNILGVAICCQEAIRLMDGHGITDGHIININSIAGDSVPSLSFAHPYSVSKHALKALSTSLHMELRAKKSKIRVTNLSPGLVRPSAMGGDPEGKAKLPIEPVRAQDIADAIVFVLGCPPNMTISQLTVKPTDEKIYV